MAFLVMIMIFFRPRRHRWRPASVPRQQLPTRGHSDRDGAFHRHLRSRKEFGAVRLRQYTARQGYNQIRQYYEAAAVCAVSRKRFF